MNRFVLIVAVLLLFGANCFAIDFMGPPTAGLKQGQWNIGAIYSFSETDLEISDADYTLKDVEINRYWANLGYGFADCWEANLRLGAANAEIDDFGGEDFSGGTDFAWGFNTKVTFASAEKIDWGALFQMSWIDTEDTIEGVDLEIDGYEMQIAAGPTLKMEGWKLYGGPFLHFVDADIEVEILDLTGSADLEEDSEFGGYVGTQIDLTENTALNIEGQVTGGGWGIGAGIGWRF